MSWFQKNFKSKKRKKEIRLQHAESVGTYAGLTPAQIQAQFEKDETTLRHENQRKTRIGVAVIAATVATVGIAAPAIAGAGGLGAVVSGAGGIAGIAAKGGKLIQAAKAGKGLVDQVRNTGTAPGETVQTNGIDVSDTVQSGSVWLPAALLLGALKFIR